MKIQAVSANNRKRSFEVILGEEVLDFPYSRAEPRPSSSDPLDHVYVDSELGGEGFTYVLRSGNEGSIHVDSILEYNEDPAYMRDLLLYELTIEANKCMAASGISRNEVLRRSKTSASQLARLLDVSNKSKSLDKMMVLFAALDCEVEVTVRQRRSARGDRASEQAGPSGSRKARESVHR